MSKEEVLKLEMSSELFRRVRVALNIYAEKAGCSYIHLLDEEVLFEDKDIMDCIVEDFLCQIYKELEILRGIKTRRLADEK